MSSGNRVIRVSVSVVRVAPFHAPYPNPATAAASTGSTRPLRPTRLRCRFSAPTIRWVRARPVPGTRVRMPQLDAASPAATSGSRPAVATSPGSRAETPISTTSTTSRGGARIQVVRSRTRAGSNW